VRPADRRFSIILADCIRRVVAASPAQVSVSRTMSDVQAALHILRDTQQKVEAEQMKRLSLVEALQRQVNCNMGTAQPLGGDAFDLLECRFAKKRIASRRFPPLRR
jgi:hypothetical protein